MRRSHSLCGSVGRTTARCLALSMLFAPAIAPAQTLTRNFTKNILRTDLSVWPTGYDVGSNLDRILIGGKWDPFDGSLPAYFDLKIPAFVVSGVTITPAINLGKTGMNVGFRTGGRVGFEMQPYYNGGRMDLDFTEAVSVTYPAIPRAGQTVTVSANARTASNSSYQTKSPDFGIAIDAVANVSASASGQAWFLNSSLFKGDIFPEFDRSNYANVLGMTKFSDTGALDTIAQRLNQGTGAANPFPVNAVVLRPTLAASGTVKSDGTVSGNAFAPFLSVQTDMLSWVAMFFTGGIGNLLPLLSGNYPVPGTGLDVAWDISKIYANLDLGFRGDFTVYPTSQVTLLAYNESGTLLGSGVGSVTFTMPNGRVRIVPKLTLGLDLDTRLAFSSDGTIGVSPIRMAANGRIGSGSHAQTIDTDIDPAKVSWSPDPAAGGKIRQSRFALPLTVTEKDTTLPEFTLRPLSETDLPPAVYYNTNQTSIELPAYDADANTEDAPSRKFDLTAEQGFIFFKNNASWNATGKVVDVKTGSSVDVLSIFSYGATDTVLRVQVPASALTPGSHVLMMTVTAKNNAGQVRTMNYQIPLQAYYKPSVLSGGLNADFIAENGSTVTNRVNVDGQDHKLAILAQYLYADSQVVLDDGTVLPRRASSDVDVNEVQTLQFTVPAAVAQRMADGTHSVRLRTRDLKGDGSGYLYSNSVPLYFKAASPTLSSYAYRNQTGGTLPLALEDSTFEIRGTGFTANSRVDLNGGFHTPLTPTFSSPGVLRVTVTKKQMEDIHKNSSSGSFTIQVSNPTYTIPAVPTSGLPSAKSGGLSVTIPLQLVHRAPLITRMESSIVLKDVPDQVIRIYGDNLLRDASNYYGANLLRGLGDRVRVTYPPSDGLSVPYFDLTLRQGHAAISNLGVSKIHLDYRDAVGPDAELTTEYGKPSLLAQSTDILRLTGGSASVTVKGGPFYPETTAYVNGIKATTQFVNSTSMIVTLQASQLDTLTGTSTTTTVNNPTPGGGESDGLQLRLIEANPAQFSVKPGAFVYDRKTGKWLQNLDVVYNGTHELPTAVEVSLTGLPASVEPSGTDVSLVNGVWRVRFSPAAGRRQIAFLKKAAEPLSYTPTLTIP